MVCSLGSCCCSSRRRRASISVSSGARPLPDAVLAVVELALLLGDEALAGRNCLAAGGELVAGAEKELLGVAQLGEACLDLREPLGVRLGRRLGHGHRDADHGFRTGRVELELARPRGERGLSRGDARSRCATRLLATLCVDPASTSFVGDERRRKRRPAPALPGGRLFASASA